MKISILFISTLLFTSCFKTAEEIRRDKLVDQQLDQSSKTIANLNEQIAELKGVIASTSGKIEEINYNKNQENTEEENKIQTILLQITEQLKALTDENQLQKEQISVLSKEIEQQKSYIKNVTKALKGFNGKEKTKSSTSLLSRAHKAFEKNKQKEARKLYNQVLSEEKINNAQKNHVYFNLGLLDYWNKKYNESLVYFSKIYTKYPKSSLAPRSLLYIARAFKKSSKTEEAKATMAELIKKYPKSKQATVAKEEIKQL